MNPSPKNFVVNIIANADNYVTGTGKAAAATKGFGSSLADAKARLADAKKQQDLAADAMWNMEKAAGASQVKIGGLQKSLHAYASGIGEITAEQTEAKNVAREMQQQYDMVEKEIQDLNATLDKARAAYHGMTEEQHAMFDDEFKARAKETIATIKELEAQQKLNREEIDKQNATYERLANTGNQKLEELFVGHSKLSDQIIDETDEFRANELAMEQLSHAQAKMADNTRAAEAEVAKLSKTTAVLKDVMVNYSAELSRVGMMLTAFGGGIEAIAVKSARTFMTFEQGMAGVAKTTNASSDEMATLTAGIRDLAKTIPVTHEELSNAAMMAGQLGVHTKDILGFTEQVAKLGYSIEGLSTEQAASELAQFMTIMGDDYSLVGSYADSIINLGNNTATTEAKILTMSKRISSTGSALGMSASQVMALSAALLETGVSSEMGGTAVSRVMMQITQDVSANSDKMKAWAKVAGYETPTQFKQAWESDVMGTLLNVAKGLNDLGQGGASELFGFLDDTAEGGVRVTEVLLKLGATYENLGDKLLLAQNAQGSLNKEFDIFASTTMSKRTVAMNRAKDASIDAGEALAPLVAIIASAVSDTAGAWQALPDWLQKVGVYCGVTTGAIAILGGGLLTLAAKVTPALDAIKKLENALVNTKFGTFTTGLLGVQVAATTFATTLGIFHEYSKRKLETDNLEVGLNQIAVAFNKATQSGQDMIPILDELFNVKIKEWKPEFFSFDGLKEVETQIEGIAELAYRANTQNSNWWKQTAHTLFGSVDLEAELATRLSGIQSVLLNMLNESPEQAEQAAQIYLALVQELRAGERPVEQVNQDFAEFTAGLEIFNDTSAASAKRAETLSDTTASLADIYDALDDAQKEVHASLRDLGADFDNATRILQKYADAGDEVAAKFGAIAQSFATQAAEISNLNNAWEMARGELERPPSARAWLEQIDIQLAAVENFQKNAVIAYQWLANYLPASMQETGAEIIAALTPEQLDMFTNVFSDAEATEFINKSARIGQLAGDELGADLAESVMLKLAIFGEEPIEVALVAQLDPDGEVPAWQEATSETLRPAIEPNIEAAYTARDQIQTLFSNPIKFSFELGTPSPISASSLGPKFPGLAAGGAIYGGVRGKDSVPALLMPGEHVLTVADVVAMGGHAGVYAFREALGNPVARYAGGGAVRRMITGGAANGSSGFPAYNANAGWVTSSPAQVKAIENNTKALEKAAKLVQDAAKEAVEAEIKAAEMMLDATLNIAEGKYDRLVDNADLSGIGIDSASLNLYLELLGTARAQDAANKAKDEARIGAMKVAQIAAIKAVEKAAKDSYEARKKAADELYDKEVKAALAVFDEVKKRAEDNYDRIQKQLDLQKTNLLAAIAGAQVAHDKLAGSFANAAAAASSGVGAWKDAWDQAELIARGAARAAETLGLAWDDAFKPPSMTDWRAAMQKQADSYQTFKGFATTAMSQVKAELPTQMAIAAEAMLQELIDLGPDSQDALELFTTASRAERKDLVETWLGTGSYLGEDFGKGLADQSVTVKTAWDEYTRLQKLALDDHVATTKDAFDAQRAIVENSYDLQLGAALTHRDETIAAAQQVRDETIKVATEKRDAEIAAAQVAYDTLIAQSGALRARLITNAEDTKNELVEKLNELSKKAASSLDAAKSAWDTWQPQSKTATVVTNYVSTGQGFTGGFGTGAGRTASTPSMYPPMIARADGGLIPGTPPSNPREDNIVAMIRSGEFVQSQPAVDYYGPGFMAALNARAIPKDVLPAFNAGGYVGAGTPIPAQNLNYTLVAGEGKGNTYTVNLTSHHAVAEPESVVINKGLDKLAALAGGY